MSPAQEAAAAGELAGADVDDRAGSEPRDPEPRLGAASPGPEPPFDGSLLDVESLLGAASRLDDESPFDASPFEESPFDGSAFEASVFAPSGDESDFESPAWSDDEEPLSPLDEARLSVL